MSEMTAETTSSTLAGTVRAPTSVWAWYKAGGDILVFISIWLASTLFAGQDLIIEKWSFRYLLAVVPAVVFPILRFKQTLNNLLFGGARPIVVFGVAGLIWLLASGDLAGIPPLFLIVWVAGWVCRAEVSIVRKHLFALAVCFYAVAVFAYAASYSLVDLSAPEYSWMKSPLWEPVPAEPDAEVASPEITSPEVASPEVASSGSAPTESHELLLPDQTRAGINLNPWGVLPHQMT